jgi:hypothetical protein
MTVNNYLNNSTPSGELTTIKCITPEDVKELIQYHKTLPIRQKKLKDRMETKQQRTLENMLNIDPLDTTD